MDGGLGLLLEGSASGNFDPVMPKDSGIFVPGDAASLTYSDFDADGKPDFVFGMNDAPVEAFHRMESTPLFSIQLKGKKGNPTAVGARLEAKDRKGRILATKEITAGEGYLSQSSAWLFFRKADQPVTIRIRWPNGSNSSHSVDQGKSQLTVQQP